jgi:PAS domain S-box-containing protein
MRILYVVDEHRDADLTRRWLSQYASQFRLETVATQGDAMARINGREAPSFDLVLTDLRLPDGDGLSLLSYIRERALPLAVVVITGIGDEETAVAVLKAGADDYIAKRNNYLERLPLTLENALHRYRTSASRHKGPLKRLYADHDITDLESVYLRTELIRTQEALRISEERFARAFHRTTDALSISRESDSRIIEVNEGWVKLFGYSREEAVGRTPLELNVYVNEADRQSLSELRSWQGFVRDLEMEMYTKAGEVRQVSVSAETTVIGGEPCFITIARDLTEQRRTEEALFKAEAELAHVDRVTTMGELAASIAHEVNQPLTAVIATADLCYAKSQSGKADANEIQEMLSEVVADARRVNEIISRIRGLLHKSNPVKVPLAINDIIREVCAMLMSEMTLKRIRLNTELEADLPLILGDRIQLQQVLLNLIENGVEAMLEIKDRSRELLIKSAKNDAREVMVSVRDSGCGVGSKDLERIFEPFYTTKATGMGMGLSISRRIIRDHEGKMWAVPNAGCGLTFHFSLPFFSDERRYSR